jgi:uncharacterized linocin/CFP29 family protein
VINTLFDATDPRTQALRAAFDSAMLSTAKCREAIAAAPGEGWLKQTAIVVPRVNDAGSGFDADVIASPIHVCFDFTLDDRYANDDARMTMLVQMAGAHLGSLEDVEIITGVPGNGRVARNDSLERARLNDPIPGSSTPIANPTSAESICDAIADAVAALTVSGRPGAFGALLHPRLAARLSTRPANGGEPLLRDVERLLGSTEVASTPALSDLSPGSVCGVLFRLQPAAVDLVHTMAPTINRTGQANGATTFRAEEEIALRIIDQRAVHHLRVDPRDGEQR